jgi:hypothetical protein
MRNGLHKQRDIVSGSAELQGSCSAIFDANNMSDYEIFVSLSLEERKSSFLKKRTKKLLRL